MTSPWAPKEAPAICLPDRSKETIYREALQFIREVAVQELPFNPPGQGAEVALRHILRRANEALKYIPP